MFFNFKKVIISVIIIFLSSSIFAQSPLVEVYGNITDDNRDLVGVLIQVTQGSKVVSSTMTDPNGEYAFTVPLGGEFLAVVSRDGYVSKKFTISTIGVPAEKVDSKFQPIGAAISLFKKMEGVDYSLLNDPMMKFSYNVEDETFEYDKAHQAQMSAGIQQIKLAEKAIRDREKEKEARYNLLVKDGDKAFARKDWQNSINNYQEALKIKPKEIYPQAQVANITKIMGDLAAQAKIDADAKAKLAADAAAKKAADDLAAKQKAEAEAAAKAKADKELADKLAKEKADADAKAQAEAAAKAKADKELADKLAKEKADADAKAQSEAAAKAKADKELADKLAKEKADADAKAKSEAEAKEKERLAALEKKQADDAAAKAKADNEALLKKQADDALAKKNADDAAAKSKLEKEQADKLAKEKADADARAKADADFKAKATAEQALAAQKKAEADKAQAEKDKADQIARDKAAADALAMKMSEASAKEKADKELADKLEKEKNEGLSKANADALAKKMAREEQEKKAADASLAQARADKEKAEKLAAEKALADKKALDDAKARNDADALAKKKADQMAKEKADKELADALALEKERQLADAKKKEEADRQAKEKLTADATKGKSDKVILPTLSPAEAKYKEAIRKGENFMALRRFLDAKTSFEEALAQKGNDTYAKERLVECEKQIGADLSAVTDARQKQLLAKYPEGVTEETIPGEGVVIIKRVLVKSKTAYVYEKKLFNWGGTACFRDGNAITELVFEQETKR